MSMDSLQVPQFDKTLTTQYEQITNSAISPENIEIFYETALKALVALMEKVVADYKRKHPDTDLTGKNLEDEATEEKQLKSESVALCVKLVAVALNAVKRRSIFS